jgi:hypothetical protein
MPKPLEYSVVTKASPEQVWGLFCDRSSWSLIANTYENIRWIQGEPWQVGSRLAFDLLRPFRVSVEQVIIASEPPHKLGWIDHALGVTVEQWLRMEELPEGGTRLSVWAETAGVVTVLFGHKVETLLRDFTVDWYDRFREECDRRAASAKM